MYRLSDSNNYGHKTKDVLWGDSNNTADTAFDPVVSKDINDSLVMNHKTLVFAVFKFLENLVHVKSVKMTCV